MGETHLLSRSTAFITALVVTSRSKSLDLAWWLVFDSFIGDSSRPDGYGSRTVTLAAWSDFTSVLVLYLDW